MKATVQLSLDLINLDEALRTAEMALRIGVDWLDVGTPLIIAEGMRGFASCTGDHIRNCEQTGDDDRCSRLRRSR